MKTIGEFSLESDENGLVTLQCNRCKSRFKMDCGYLNEEINGDIFCPICGIADSLNTFWPEEVIEEATRIAENEAQQMIISALKGLDSKYFKVKTKPVKRVNRKIGFKNKDFDMQQIEVECCKKKIGLNSHDFTAGYYCPYCGRIVK